MKRKAQLQLLLILMLGMQYPQIHAQQKNDTASGRMIRIAELEIFPKYLDEYKTALIEEARQSISKEPGVIAIMPFYLKDMPAQIRILEVYASREAYETHLKSPHFLHYKNSTLKMVKSLKLVDMNSLDLEMMKDVLRKIN
jgi:quinol monooxygenase YgiN